MKCFLKYKTTTQTRTISIKDSLQFINTQISLDYNVMKL